MTKQYQIISLQIRAATALLLAACSFSRSAFAETALDSAEDAREVKAELAASTAEMNYEQSHYSSIFRVAVAAGATLEANGKGSPAPIAQLSAELGRGLFTFEAGVSGLQVGLPVALTDTGGGKNHTLETQSEYLGVPLLVHCNYIERKDAAFSFKAGAMPAIMMNNRGPLTDHSGSAQAVVLNPRELFVVAGFTGSTPLSARTSFLVDGSFLYGTRDIDFNGTHNQGVSLVAGVRFSI